MASGVPVRTMCEAILQLAIWEYVILTKKRSARASGG